MSLIEAAREAVYLKNFLLELSLANFPTTTLFVDNMSALRLANNSTYPPRSKHIDIKFHFMWKVLKECHISLNHVGNDMIADILTKCVPHSKHMKCVELLGLS